MGHTVIEDIEDRIDNRVIRRKGITTDDPQYPSGYRYALHYGYTDGRDPISVRQRTCWSPRRSHLRESPTSSVQG